MSLKISDTSHRVGFDFETTGVDAYNDVPVSYAMTTQRIANGLSTFVDRVSFVNPGRPIPAGAAAVHGITDFMVADAPGLHESALSVRDQIFTLWADGGVLVGMNLVYDLTMLDSVCRREGIEGLRGLDLGPIADIYVMDKAVDRYRKGKRNLSSLCEHYGVTITNAHTAEADTQASLEVLDAMIGRLPEVANLETSQINGQLAAWHRESSQSLSEYFAKNGKNPIDPRQFAWPLYEL
jgi:DNA polymerase-3 subunit epsilon